MLCGRKLLPLAHSKYLAISGRNSNSRNTKMFWITGVTDTRGGTPGRSTDRIAPLNLTGSWVEPEASTLEEHISREGAKSAKKGKS